MVWGENERPGLCQEGCFLNLPGVKVHPRERQNTRKSNEVFKMTGAALTDSVLSLTLFFISTVRGLDQMVSGGDGEGSSV